MAEHEVQSLTSSSDEGSGSDDSDETTLGNCRICGDTASGVNYGVVSCENCRIFFRRIHLSQRQLVCTKYGDCLVPVGKMDVRNTNCGACRYKECLKQGMFREDKERYFVPPKRFPVDQPGTSSSFPELSKFYVPGVSDSPSAANSRPSSPESSSDGSSDDEDLHDSDTSGSSGVGMCPPCGPTMEEQEVSDRFQTSLEFACKYMLELDFGKAREMKTFFNSRRKEIWEELCEELAKVVASVTTFAYSIPEFTDQDFTEQTNQLNGSVFAMSLILLSRGFDKELGQIHIGDVCYPSPRLLFHDEDIEKNAELKFLDDVFKYIADLHSYNMSVSELAVVMALTLFEGDGFEYDYMRGLLCKFVPSHHHYIYILYHLEFHPSLENNFFELLKRLVREMPNVKVPQVLRGILLIHTPKPRKKESKKKNRRKNKKRK